MSALRQRVAELRLALMLLTRLPSGQLAEPAPSLAAARWAYPLAGLVVGLGTWAGFALMLALGGTPGMAALAALLAGALLTGGLHHDGLADFADGIGGGRDRAHCLEIMRDSRIGSYGVLALVLVLALMGTSIAALGDRATIAPFLALACASRLFMLGAMTWLPPARADGLGHSAAGSGARALLPGLALCALLILFAGPAMVAALAPMALIVFTTARLARRRIGGQTGDVLGAVQLLTECGGWVALALML
ncbi:adenosylcobinamide-GDP ribazoletransferase [Poseidonocella sedimentorum]|uniref:Adenosylcobinamide-GDP ribazoletransferase n=1 Tax=Poseidonocella sedimentorum TaxID=871652 RepID=A0A1I6EK63_9RHOB|nr:adenosylcobinamide-GDP ribazoletransferase [Poseidonocella sedimentorum]SFR18144.1 cobalamin-5'-phosphate synthase [Poseidonocella sedimentorum]